MRRLPLALLLLLAPPAWSDAPTAAAVDALRSDASREVRARAASALGRPAAPQAVQALRDAVARDGAAPVRVAAVEALARLGDRAARPTLRHAAEADPDPAVRRAAARALAELGPVALSIDDPAGPDAASVPLRDALRRHLAERGFSVEQAGELRLRPAVSVEVEESGGRTVVAVTTSLVIVDGDGRVDMVEARARAAVAGPRPSDAKLAGHSARIIDAAARGLSDDLAERLGAR